MMSGNHSNLIMDTAQEGKTNVHNEKEKYPLLLKSIAEFIATGGLVFLSCMAFSVPNESCSFQTSLVGGLSVTAMIFIFGHISGAIINPALTISLVITRELKWTEALVYICSQIFGSVFGFGLLILLTNPISTGLCLTLPNSTISSTQAIFIEFIITTFIGLALCVSFGVKRIKPNDSSELRIGLIVTIIGIVAGPYTGASMNPARSVGPALWHLNFTSHYIYWIGPISGGVAAGIIYRFILKHK